jgi:asparagine N-glycosylation enzyme membrane subunit Stt3
MSKKSPMIKKLNEIDKPYNLQVQIGGKENAYVASVTLTIMDKPQMIDGRTVQPSHRVVSTQGSGVTIEEAKDKALTEALQFAGII